MVFPSFDWAYLMRVIPEMSRVHRFRYLPLYCLVRFDRHLFIPGYIWVVTAFYKSQSIPLQRVVIMLENCCTTPFTAKWASITCTLDPLRELVSTLCPVNEPRNTSTLPPVNEHRITSTLRPVNEPRITYTLRPVNEPRITSTLRPVNESRITSTLRSLHWATSVSGAICLVWCYGV